MVKCLEIGFGNGCLLGFGRHLGLEMEGVELNSVLRQRALNAGFRVFDSTHSLPESYFDVAVAFDVMEHVHGFTEHRFPAYCNTAM